MILNQVQDDTKASVLDDTKASVLDDAEASVLDDTKASVLDDTKVSVLDDGFLKNLVNRHFGTWQDAPILFIFTLVSYMSNSRNENTKKTPAHATKKQLHQVNLH